MRVNLTDEDRGALQAFGVSSLTTNTVFVEPRWEYLPVAPHRRIVVRCHARDGATAPYGVPFVDRRGYRTERRPIGVVGAYWGDWGDAWQGRTMPTPDVVIGASRDPMARHPWSLEIEHAATAFLAAHGDHLPRPDVYVPRFGRYVTRSEPTAFRGVARFVPATPCRYGRNGNMAAVEVNAAGVAEYLTTDLSAPLDGVTRRGWRGHRRITWSTAPRRRGDPTTAKRAARRVQREASGVRSKRGRAVAPWDLSERSLGRAVTAAGVTEQVAALEAILRTSADGAVVTFGDVRVSIIGAVQVADEMHGAYPVREWARRAALAGVDPTAI